MRRTVGSAAWSPLLEALLLLEEPRLTSLSDGNARPRPPTWGSWLLESDFPGRVDACEPDFRYSMLPERCDFTDMLGVVELCSSEAIPVGLFSFSSALVDAVESAGPTTEPMGVMPTAAAMPKPFWRGERSASTSWFPPPADSRPALPEASFPEAPTPASACGALGCSMSRDILLCFSSSGRKSPMLCRRFLSSSLAFWPSTRPVPRACS
mmetsp:Transcript_29004/g.72861  ORF Transcript_29004/g.72861 Transcript_29004/m.72861 type:complete len:210 (+) Transcript_29004:143-772(+)